jgi:hypothetical protein
MDIGIYLNFRNNNACEMRLNRATCTFEWFGHLNASTEYACSDSVRWVISRKTKIPLRRSYT